MPLGGVDDDGAGRGGSPKRARPAAGSAGRCRAAGHSARPAGGAHRHGAGRALDERAHRLGLGRGLVARAKMGGGGGADDDRGGSARRAPGIGPRAGGIVEELDEAAAEIAAAGAAVWAEASWAETTTSRVAAATFRAKEDMDGLMIRNTSSRTGVHPSSGPLCQDKHRDHHQNGKRGGLGPVFVPQRQVRFL